MIIGASAIVAILTLEPEADEPFDQDGWSEQ
jgi:uncharacterized protein with PIN domain